MQVYSYIRVSGRGQIEGDGPERQRDAIAAFCKTHRLLLVGEAFEKAVSGTIEGIDRPAFSDMLDRIKHLATNGIFVEAIVVERADRLARDLMVSELLLAGCRKLGIMVFSADRAGSLVDIATNAGDPTHKLIRQVIAAVAEFEKSALVKRLRLSRERVRAKTGRCEGAKPYGYFPGEREVLAYLDAVMQEAPRPSYQGIVSLLNLAGLRNRRGNVWTKGQVGDLLQRWAINRGKNDLLLRFKHWPNDPRGRLK